MKINLLLLLSLCAFQAHALHILTSIKPIQMIAHELVLEEDSTSSLLPVSASPHDYALKPSDIVAMHNSDLIIWFGHDLEGFLTKPISNLEYVLTLSDSEHLTLRAFGKSCGCGKSHGSYDPHIWLGPQQAREVAQSITERLIEMDKKNQTRYQLRLEAFNRELSETVFDISTRLEPIRDKGYFVFHDAYGYFEEHFELNNLGYFTVDPERKSGAKKLNSIRTTLLEKNVQCVFSEPQFTPSVIKSTTKGTSTQIGRLDPLGTDIEVHDGSYFSLLDSITDGLTECFSDR
ncbi:zinc ABC transporter substrate-binding protein [Vibrio makurazakiensis]|uniref:zinc ABC transporter substrate-binding protein n=1 Tax=Vibrio makurazakiensis TaxID=2910250 RepID=UPI003D141584